jgi:hypothetical protein
MAGALAIPKIIIEADGHCDRYMMAESMMEIRR